MKNIEYTDHDMLVRLDVKVDGVDTKVEGIKNDLLPRVVKLEARADAIDVYHASIPLKRYDDIANWAEGFRANIKLFIAVGGVIVTLVAALLNALAARWLHI